MPRKLWIALKWLKYNCSGQSIEKKETIKRLRQKNTHKLKLNDWGGITNFISTIPEKHVDKKVSAIFFCEFRQFVRLL